MRLVAGLVGLCSALVDATAAAQSTGSVSFPLKLSGNRRYLVDQQEKPFLVKQISAWGLIQALPESDAADFMDEVVARGFNTLMVSVISWDQRVAGGPPRWNGNSPFLVEWDFSTPNATYYEHVDRILALARSKGLLMFLVPAYLGYPDDPTQGWASRLLDTHNSPQKSLAYGRFLGSRYKDTPNIVWQAGGDNDATGSLQPHMSNMILGIKELSAQMWTGHWGVFTIWSTNNAAYAQWMDIDGLYAWTESALGGEGPQYKAQLARYSRGKIMIPLDQSYERDVPHFADNDNPQWIRRKNYDGLLSGCAGTSFSPGTSDNQLYVFQNWRPLMNTQGMREAQYAFRLFESRPWHQLVPDTQGSIVALGRGTFGDIDYACTARTQNGSSVIVYVPTQRGITVDMSQIAGVRAKAFWYDPRSGSATVIGTFAAAGHRVFASPAGGDAVLVLDDASANFPPPGTVTVQPVPATTPRTVWMTALCLATIGFVNGRRRLDLPVSRRR